MLPLVGTDAENESPAGDDAVDTLTLRLAETIRSLAVQRDFVKMVQADLSRRLKNARKSFRRLNKKAKAVRDADLFEMQATRSDATGMSVDSELTAAAPDLVQFGEEPLMSD